MKIIFFGSDDFAQHHLEQLLGSSYQVAVIITQPDKPKGRSLRVEPSPIKVCAQKNNIPVMQPQKIKDEAFIDELKRIGADFFIVIAYGKILPQGLLDLPKKAAVNVHASLLPKYRGAAPINWAIINGEKETGVSIIKMSAELDAGDILSQSKMKISDDDTALTLREKMKNEGAELLLQTIKTFEKIVPAAQNPKEVSFAPKLTKELGKIDWRKEAQTIHNLVRGLQPWPSAYTVYQNKLLKILSSEVVDGSWPDKRPGEVVEILQKGFIIKTKQQGLLIKDVHLEASKPMDANSFIRGHRLDAGFVF